MLLNWIKQHWRWWLIMFAGLLLVSRRPDLILNAQFWAEDGAYWFREAYTEGWNSLLKPHTGYFQTLSRLVSVLTQVGSLVWAPLVFNLAAVGVRLCVVWYLFSPRFLVGVSNWWRIVAAIVYIGLPNSAEVFANLTNAHWHLALLAFMVAWSRPPLGWQKWTDLFIFLLMGLSGPFVLVVAPLALWYWYRQGEWGIRRISVVALLITFATQLCVIFLASTDQRTTMELGASVTLLVKILVGQIAVAGIIGEKGYSLLWRHGLFVSIIWFSIFAVSVSAAIAAFRRGPIILRYGLVAAVALLAASLISPMASTTLPQWSVMLLPGAAGRYWFIPSLAFIGMMSWWLHTGPESWRWMLKIMFGVVLLFGIVWNWRLTPWPQTNFAEQARQFSDAAPGTIVTFTLVPASWAMTLVK